MNFKNIFFLFWVLTGLSGVLYFESPGYTGDLELSEEYRSTEERIEELKKIGKEDTHKIKRLEQYLRVLEKLQNNPTGAPDPCQEGSSSLSPGTSPRKTIDSQLKTK